MILFSIEIWTTAACPQLWWARGSNMQYRNLKYAFQKFFSGVYICIYKIIVTITLYYMRTELLLIWVQEVDQFNRFFRI